MTVTVMSRAEAVRYCHKKHENESIIISISTPNMYYGSSPVSVPGNGVISVLRLVFADADRPNGRDVYGTPVSESDLMTDQDALQIARFLNILDKYPDADVIVHCDAGISRSSGVAAAILKYKTGNDFQIFKNNRYHPNMWCYRKTLEALMLPNKPDQSGN